MTNSLASRSAAEYEITRVFSTPDLVRQSVPHALSYAYDRGGSWIYDPYEGLWRDSQIFEKVRYDNVLAAGFENRFRHVGGTQAEVIPAKMADEGDKFSAILVGGLIDDIPYYSGARKMLAEADVLGEQWMALPGEYVLKLLPGDSRPRKWWQPGRLIHLDKRRFRLIPVVDPEQTDYIRTAWQLWSVRRRRWETMSAQARSLFIRHTFEEREDGLGYARGLLASIFHWWRLGTLVMEYGLQAAEVYAKGIVDAGIDGLRLGDPDATNQAQVKAWKDVVRSMADSKVLVHDKDEEWNVIWPNGSIVDIPLQWKRYFDSAALRLIQAGDQTTGMDSADKGSYGAVQGMRKGAEDYFATPRGRLEESLNSQHMSRIWLKNKRPMQEALLDNGYQSARCPSIALDTPTTANPKESIEMIHGMQEAGMKVGRQWAHDIMNVPIPDDDFLEPVQQDQGGGMFPGMDFGSSDESEAQGPGGARAPIGEGPDADDSRFAGASLRGAGARLATCKRGQTAEKTDCTPAQETGGKSRATRGDSSFEKKRAAGRERAQERQQSKADRGEQIGDDASPDLGSPPEPVEVTDEDRDAIDLEMMKLDPQTENYIGEVQTIVENLAASNPAVAQAVAERIMAGNGFFDEGSSGSVHPFGHVKSGSTQKVRHSPGSGFRLTGIGSGQLGHWSLSASGKHVTSLDTFGSVSSQSSGQNTPSPSVSMPSALMHSQNPWSHTGK